jgi:hypothetical protein
LKKLLPPLLASLLCKQAPSNCFGMEEGVSTSRTLRAASFEETIEMKDGKK